MSNFCQKQTIAYLQEHVSACHFESCIANFKTNAVPLEIKINRVIIKMIAKLQTVLCFLYAESAEENTVYGSLRLFKFQ